MFNARIHSLLLLSALSVLFLGFSLRCNQPTIDSLPKVTLNYWRVFDATDSFNDVIDAYQQTRPNVHINYKKLRFDEYEDTLLNALAEDRGPDVVSIHNTWMGKYVPKLLPAPQQIQIPVKTVEGTIKQEEVIRINAYPGPTPASVRNDFVDQVSNDVVWDNKVYGLPVAIDTMALFYNRTLLSQANIAQPPATWEEFQRDMKALTHVDDKGAIVQAGGAIGGSANVPRSFDLLSALMAQTGARLTDENSLPVFASAAGDPSRSGAADALRFYTDFANPQKEVYTWNATLPNALELFMGGRLAMFFGYAYQIPDLERTQTIDWGVAPFPMLTPSNKVTEANYWIETVTNKTKYPNEAWDFVRFITSQDHAPSVLAQLKRPTARRALLSTQASDPILGVFVGQALTARNWYRGTNIAATEKAFATMIDDVTVRNMSIEEALKNAQTTIRQTFPQ